MPVNLALFRKNISIHNDAVHIDIWYPGIDDNPKYLEVGLMHVRASDGIRIHYDFERDGFVVEQPKPRIWKTADKTYDGTEDWIEVGFFQSWQFNDRDGDGPTEEEFAKADADFEISKSK